MLVRFRASWYIPRCMGIYLVIRGLPVDQIRLRVDDAVIQRGLLDARDQKLHGGKGHDLGVDVDGAQRGAAAPGFGRIVEAEQQHVLRDGLPDGEERAQHIARHKIIGADEEIGH